MEFPDYYQVLGVSRTASEQEIKKAYRNLARKWHPDSYQGDDQDGAEKKFREVSEAYEVLSDPESRQKYDELGAGWKHGRPAGVRAESRTMSPEEFEQIFGGRGFSDFFTTFFGDDLASHFGRQPHRHARFREQGADVRARIQVPLVLAARGGSSTFDVEAQTVCTTCGGAGLWEQQHICPACGGLGRRRGRRRVNVKIPPGIRPGQTMRLKGLGEPGLKGGAAGDLYLTVEIAGDGVFEPRGDDVHAELPVAPWEAALGAKVPVRTLDGQVLLTVPAGTGSGAKLRVRGQGLTRSDGTRGDLLVTIRMELPKTLRPEHLEHLRRIQESGAPTVSGGARANGSGP